MCTENTRDNPLHSDNLPPDHLAGKIVSTCKNPTVTQGNWYRQKQWETKEIELKRSKF